VHGEQRHYPSVVVEDGAEIVPGHRLYGTDTPRSISNRYGSAT
jgi:hypothetical protein